MAYQQGLLRHLGPVHEISKGWFTSTQSLYHRKALEDNKYFIEHEDPDLREIATQEREEIQQELDGLLNELPRLLLPQTESTSHLSALLELKIGVGGTESSLFLTDMLRMYTRYSATKNWVVTTISMNENDAGGAKEAIIEVKGRGSYDALRWESGVHRVQRVPATESGGRTHTSTVAAIVRPNHSFLGPIFYKYRSCLDRKSVV